MNNIAIIPAGLVIAHFLFAAPDSVLPSSN